MRYFEGDRLEWAYVVDIAYSCTRQGGWCLAVVIELSLSTCRY